MPESLSKGRWSTTAVLLGSIALLISIAADFGGKAPELRARDRPATESAPAVPLARIQLLFAAKTLAEVGARTNPVNPFFTAYFQPPPSPPPAPPPKPPTTRKIDLIYRGSYQSAQGTRHAFVLVGDRLFVGPVGAKVIADWVVTDIALRSLTLQDGSARTNVLAFNRKQEVEIPAP